MYSKFMRICSIVLSLVLIVHLLPAGSLAAQPDSSASQAITANEQIQDDAVVTAPVEDAVIIAEVPDGRTEFSKEYQLSNGLQMATVYADAIHYQNNGQWLDIDNTLRIVGTGTNAAYANTAGVWDVRFPQTMSSSKAVTITKDGYTLSFSLAGELRASGNLELATANASGTAEVLAAQQMRSASAQVIELDLSAAKAAADYPETVSEKLKSRLQYSNVFDNTSIVYDLNSNEVKESIIIGSYAAALRGYQYTLNVGSMIPVLQDSGEIWLYDETRENVVMAMPAPFMLDAAGAYCPDVQVALTGSGSTYTLTYTLPRSWMADTARRYPVVLDPVVTANINRTNIKDIGVYENEEEADYIDYNYGAIECGHTPVYGAVRSFVKYEQLPTLTSADVIVHAEFRLCKYTSHSTPLTVEIHKVNDTWTSQGMVWSTQPDHDPLIEDYAIVQGIGYYTFVITDLAQGWYEGENTGLMFRAPDSIENTTSSTSYLYKFYSSDYDVYQYEEKPTLFLYYRNNNGLENYWDYTSVSAGRAGTGYVNDYSGNLVWVRNDMGFGGNRMPVSISHVYNSNDSLKNEFGMGYGWRTNYNQRVYPMDGNSNYYVWEDADGTKHYFLRTSSTSTTYKDEDGLNLTLTVSSSGSSVITDLNGNRSNFDSKGRLISQYNYQFMPSYILISYTDTNSYRISSIQDGAYRKYNFTYNTNNLLSQITYVGKGASDLYHTTYTYINGTLLSIKDNDNEYSYYSYNSNNLLRRVNDIDNYQIDIQYSTGQPSRVVDIAGSEFTTLDGHLQIEYAHNQTTFTDHNGNVLIKQFNNFGNTVSVQDGEGRAQFAQYANNGDVNPKNPSTEKLNQLTLSSRMQNTVGNLVPDGNFETGGKWGANKSIVTTTNVTETAYSGTHCVRVDTPTVVGNCGACSPFFYVEPGQTVTVSAYVKSSEIPVRMGFHCPSGNFVIHGETINPTNEWVHAYASYTNDTDSRLQMAAYLFNVEAGTSYFDCAQVELSAAPSRYNLLANGDFVTTGYWNSSAGITQGIEQATPQLTGGVYKIIGSPTSQNRIYQTIPLSGQAGDTFVLGGWAKADAAPLTGNGRTFGLRLIFNTASGLQYGQIISFNPDTDSSNHWQYASAPVIAPADYTSLLVYIFYDYNVNIAYFDGIQLFKEEFGTSYTYDDNGNVISTTNLQKQQTTYEYTNNNLTKAILPSGVTMTYTYDGYHNVKTATSTAGQSYAFNYDIYGNNTSVTITADGQTLSSQATYTSDGNYMLTSTDAAGNVTQYGYDPDTGVLEWVQYPNDSAASRTTYTYDSMFRLAGTTALVGNQTLSANYTYQDDLLTKIATPTTEYTFTYGNLNLRSSVAIGDRTLASYTYSNDRNNYLTALDYGNGDGVEYTYDDQGRVTAQTYEDGDTVTYTYDNTGALATVTDSATGRTTTYYYDLTDRMVKYVESGTGYSHSVAYEYNALNNLTRLVEAINGTQTTTTYTYDEDNRLTGVSNGLFNREHRYDDFGRVDMQFTKCGTDLVQSSEFVYRTIGTATTGQLESIRLTGDGFVIEYEYTYDANGNILSITEDPYTANYVTTYVYDEANQLIRENNQAAGKTWVWAYDNAGNILSRTEYNYTTGDLGTALDTVLYQYGDADWGDLLTSYDGNAITYDAIGNPTSDGVWNYTWERGRQLASMTSVSDSSNPSTITYTYDADGMRTGKTVSTYGTVIRYEYVYRGGLLMQEVIKTTIGIGEDATVTTNTLNYFYDGRGLPAAVTYNGTIYYYVVNGQGDVIALTDADSSIVVSYVYDAWGNILTTTGALADTLGVDNALRYRGYVYDAETDLYYLQSRYYNAEVGRFINADAFTSTGQGLLGNNMFAYCLNNPVNMIDSSGHLPQWLEDVVDWVDENIYSGTRDIVDKLEEDYNNFNLGNTDINDLKQANYFSAYKNTFVIKGNFRSSFSYGIIGLKPSQIDQDTVDHEYGHALHFKQLGPVRYTIQVAVPSVICNVLDDHIPYDYYDATWEKIADQLGGVQRQLSDPAWPTSTLFVINGLLSSAFMPILGG